VQSVSADLDAAIEARQRQPLVRLRVDWDGDGDFDTVGSGYTDDISADVVSVDLNRELSTDLPVQAKLFSGAAASQATITLVHRDPTGDPIKHGGFFYSPLNSDSPLFAKQRKGRPVTLEFGFVTAAGTSEYVTVLVGTIRSLTVSAGARSATMIVADRSETMRKQVQLPMIIADGEDTTLAATTLKRPGLNTTFLADYVARQCGYYASPPRRSGCVLSVTHHGSGHPELGALQEHHGNNGSQLSYSPTPTFPAAAKWVQAVNTDGSAGQEMNYIMSATGGTISTNNGSTLLWEGWRKLSSTSQGQPFFIAYITGSGEPYVSAFWEHGTGTFQVTFNRQGADPTNRAAVGPTISPGTSNWHYYAVQVTFTSTGPDVTFRYDGTTTGPVHVATPSVTGVAALNTVGIARGRVGGYVDGNLNGLSEADQVTTESSTSTWNNAYTPTAQIVASSAIDNRLAATPHVTENGWELFQQIANSEFATAGFDETGLLYYWSRRRWTTAPYDTSQRSLTAATALKELATVEAVDQVRNRIIIEVRAPIVEDSSTVWKLGSRWTVPASGSITKIASLQDPVGNVDTTVVSGSALGSSRYMAGTRLDGQGSQVTNLSIALTVLSPTAVRVQVTNPNAFVVYLAADENASATYSGKPYLWIDAQIVRFGQEAGNNSYTRVDVSDSGSISDYGEQILQVDDNDFRQDDDDVEQLADDLLADLADPGPAITDVPAVGDPRLQLGDRVTIVDPDGLVMSDDFHLSAVNFSYDSGGLGMTLSLRKA
jgi:hypothetical protein